MVVDYSRLNSRVRDKFGISATYSPAGGNPRTITVIVDQEYYSETGGIGIQTESVSVQVVDLDVPELAVNDRLTINGKTYRVVEIKPDFFGMTDAILNTV
jgi:hypothetical protein